MVAKKKKRIEEKLTQTSVSLFSLEKTKINSPAWGGRLLALWEAGPPHELDPRSLETRPAPATLGGLVLPGSAPSTTGVSRALDEKLGFGSASTAHPHVVPAPPGEADVWYGLREGEGGDGEKESGGGKEASPTSSSSGSSLPSPSLSPSDPCWPSPTARLATWAWQSQMTAKGPNLSIEVAEFDASWRRVAKAKLTLPGAAFNPHDFGVSPRHYVFFQGHTTFKMLPYVVGLRGPAQCVKIGEFEVEVFFFLKRQHQKTKEKNELTSLLSSSSSRPPL